MEREILASGAVTVSVFRDRISGGDRIQVLPLGWVLTQDGCSAFCFVFVLKIGEG